MKGKSLNHYVPYFLLQQSRLVGVCHPSILKGCAEGNLIIRRFWANIKNPKGSHIATYPTLAAGLLGWRICNLANAYHLVVYKSGMLELEEIPGDYLA
jgi:hypothetical protein